MFSSSGDLSPLTPESLAERIRFADLVRHAFDSFAVHTTATIAWEDETLLSILMSENANLQCNRFKHIGTHNIDNKQRDKSEIDLKGSIKTCSICTYLFKTPYAENGAISDFIPNSCGSRI